MIQMYAEMLNQVCYRELYVKNANEFQEIKSSCNLY